MLRTHTRNCELQVVWSPEDNKALLKGLQKERAKKPHLKSSMLDSYQRTTNTVMCQQLHFNLCLKKYAAKGGKSILKLISSQQEESGAK